MLLKAPKLRKETELVRGVKRPDLPPAGTVGLRCSLSFESVSKRFGSILANDSITFEVQGGGIHAIVGENGAGKSTLSKILYGYYAPDGGSIVLNGQRLRLDSPAAARKMGIGMVHQQMALVPSLTGFENVVLGDPDLPFLFNKSRLERKVALRARELGFNLDLSSPVSNLGIADRQKLEIFKLLWRDARVLILDEPTSQLTPFEAEEVLNIAKDLADRGRIVILITHHINEVVRFAKRVTVLRQGSCVTTIETSDIGSDELAKLMIDVDSSVCPVMSAREPGPSLITLEDVSTQASAGNRQLHDITLKIRRGEVIGVAGISGSGQTELGRLLAELLQPLSGKLVRSDSVCYIPGDQRQAHAPALSVAANCFLKCIDSASAHKLGFVNGSLMNRHARRIIDSFNVTPNLADVPASALSGGNLQRMIIGRELLTEASVIVADNPCAGLDAAMSIRIRHELRQAALSDRAVVLISPDLEELITTCDRIIVMFNGRIISEQKAGQYDYHALAASMGGKA